MLSLIRYLIREKKCAQCVKWLYRVNVRSIHVGVMSGEDVKCPEFFFLSLYTDYRCYVAFVWGRCCCCFIVSMRSFHCFPCYEDIYLFYCSSWNWLFQIGCIKHSLVCGNALSESVTHVVEIFCMQPLGKQLTNMLRIFYEKKIQLNGYSEQVCELGAKSTIVGPI